MKEVYLNHSELAFIMDIPVKEAKDIFSEILGKDKTTVKDQIKVEDLIGSFKKVRSIDKRYDGQNELMFNLEQKKQLYKKFINDKSVIKQKKLTGGKSIFYKILSEKDIEFIKENLKYKWNYLYGKNTTI
jgi:hypothetical protein